ncbi:hypothetical protein PHMEG_0009029 [Phytophthora megakarya]|uniref:Auto-transporter adhesin head GIN domain-containing protein n=1 Tax=Phytophthora megakarya TaxID=4795 RepID=A0A225WH70_9STRA|nr:hypothetical protein PHMEG_0009029 [Phytophthora megakarya]
MQVYTSLALFLAAVATSRTNAYFSAKSGSTQTVTASSEHAKYTKQWTLQQNTNSDAIDAIGLDLMGTVFVNHVHGLPAGVLGYVNVTGDSQTIVDAITVRNDNAKLDNHKHGVLNITTTTAPNEGYLLTEVFLSADGFISYVEIQRSTQVVIEKGVLVTSSKNSDLVMEASGSSTVYVSDTSAAVNLADLVVETSGTANIYLHVASVTVTKDATLESRDSAAISVLASSIAVSGDAVLETQGSGTICTTAKQVAITGDYVGESASAISMPYASDKHGATGTLVCEKFTVPARKPALVKVKNRPQVMDKVQRGSSGKNVVSMEEDDEADETIAFEN